jgi:hypothetical protein
VSDLKKPSARINGHKVRHVRLRHLVPNPNNARTHSPRQIEQIARSIERFGFNNPILIDNDNHILAGHGRVAAAKRLGLVSVPTLKIEHLTGAEKRAYVLADNRIAEKAGWDEETLALELQGLVDLDFDVELTGFETGEIDVLLDGQTAVGDDADDACPDYDQTHCVTQMGDCWRMGDHILVCGDARAGASHKTLLGGKQAAYTITDPPYNVRIDGHASGLGRVHHREFAMASGEMSQAEFVFFLS